MRGRPPIPIAIKAQQGDTRQRGANKHAESLQRAHEATRGRPPFPAALKLPKMPPLPEDPKAAALALLGHEAMRNRLKVAKDHWEYLADQLDAEGMLAECDEGMLTGQAMTYALATEAFFDGRDKDYSMHWQRYMQAASLMGLNESARARLPKKADSGMDEIDKALCS